MLHEAEEEDFKPREQPQLLEQRHHHGLLQPARSGAAQRDSHPGERGTGAHTQSAPRLLVALEARPGRGVITPRGPTGGRLLQKGNISLGFQLALR